MRGQVLSGVESQMLLKINSGIGMTTFKAMFVKSKINAKKSVVKKMLKLHLTTGFEQAERVPGEDHRRRSSDAGAPARLHPLVLLLVWVMV